MNGELFLKNCSIKNNFSPRSGKLFQPNGNALGKINRLRSASQAVFCSGDMFIATQSRDFGGVYLIEIFLFTFLLLSK